MFPSFARSRRHKFDAVRCEADGIKFPSLRERDCYVQQKLKVQGGRTLFFLRQVPLHLPGGVKYVVDFLTFDADGTQHFIDAKGMRTPTYTAKKKMVEALYPIKIEEW